MQKVDKTTLFYLIYIFYKKLILYIAKSSVLLK